MKYFDIISIFPEMFSYVDESILKRAQDKKIIKIRTHDLRVYTKDKHKRVDDTPYGGGAGMLMQVEPFYRAIKKIKKRNKKTRIILTSAKGKVFKQKDAKRLSQYEQIIFLCGRYEGVDERVAKKLADEELSIGEYVLSGGELPAMVMTDAIARMIPGVLGNPETLNEESHTGEYLEYPQYTKPEHFKAGKETWSVPSVLLSGDHGKIKQWRESKQNKKSL